MKWSDCSMWHDIEQVSPYSGRLGHFQVSNADISSAPQNQTALVEAELLAGGKFFECLVCVAKSWQICHRLEGRCLICVKPHPFCRLQIVNHDRCMQIFVGGRKGACEGRDGV